MTLIVTCISGLQMMYGQGEYVRDLGLLVQTDKPPVTDEGLPVHREDVLVRHPEPGHTLVVEVVYLTLQISCATLLTSEHQVCCTRYNLMVVNIQLVFVVNSF